MPNQIQTCGYCSRDATVSVEGHSGESVSLCGDCLGYRTTTCDSCNQITMRYDAYGFIDAANQRARRCTVRCVPGGANAPRCHQCGYRFEPGAERCEANNGATVCTRCLVDYYEECLEHGYYLYSDGQCPFCPILIESYDYRPSPILYKGTGEGEPAYYLGFELEVERAGSVEAQGVRDRLPYTFCKMDGSLDDGFEIVSHPLSPAFVREHKKEIVGALNWLVRQGVRSYRTETCGMHVHVSRSAFSGSFHLFKFMEFMYRNKAFVLTVSQREEENLQRWAAIGVPPKEVIRKAKVKFNDHAERYTAINLENTNTVEVRIFRGTLKPESFFKNLEFVEALVEFTRNNGAAGAKTPEQFVDWVKKRARRYPSLADWLSSDWPLRLKVDDREL